MTPPCVRDSAVGGEAGCCVYQIHGSWFGSQLVTHFRGKSKQLRFEHRRSLSSPNGLHILSTRSPECWPHEAYSSQQISDIEWPAINQFCPELNVVVEITQNVGGWNGGSSQPVSTIFWSIYVHECERSRNHDSWFRILRITLTLENDLYIGEHLLHDSTQNLELQKNTDE